MRRVSIALATALAMVPCFGFAQGDGPYKVLQTEKVGGEGGFDYVYADDAARKLYIPRSGPAGKITVFDLDTLKPAGEIANASAHGAAVDTKSKHGFGSSEAGGDVGREEDAGACPWSRQRHQHGDLHFLRRCCSRLGAGAARHAGGT